MKYPVLFSLVLAIALQLNCNTKQSQPDAAYLAQIQEWHQKRMESLQKPNGWLSLVGLYWLKPGENSFGDDPANDIVFPADKTPAFIGTFLLQDTTVTVRINPGIPVYHDNQPVTQMVLKNDLSGDPTILNYGSLSWYIIKRGDQYGVRLKDSESPRLKNFKGIEMFPINPEWRIRATFEPYEPLKTIEVPTVLGTVDESLCPGALVFSYNGKQYQLDPIAEPDAEQLFVIFGDQTNGVETYGAGRFLYVDAPDSNNVTYIDFNKSYNPPCIFTPYATCQLPPEQNILPFKVTAGEKNYQGEGHGE
jgi:hypothetical protein